MNENYREPGTTVHDLSIIIPLYNEQAVFPELIARLKSTIDDFELLTEVILVDDGSDDATPDLAAQLCREDERFRLIALSRNFGHQSAVSAGLTHSTGQSVAILDGDLQDPPEVLKTFYEKLHEGYDVVYAIRQRRKESWPKRIAYWLFYRLLKRLSTIQIPLDSGDFCIMSQRVVKRINALPEHHRFVRGLRSWVGYRQTGLAYDRSARAAGHSKYTFFRLLNLACDGIFTFSEIPLRFATFTGFVVAAFSFSWGCAIVVWRLFFNNSLPGFATVAAGMFFLGGIHLICLGILGEYIGRIHNEVKQRPIFIVDYLVGFEASPSGEEPPTMNGSTTFSHLSK